MIRKPNSGQALALTAISLVALVGFAGLAVDMGVLRYEKHLQQTAADAAAIAGAYELRDGSSNLPTAAILAGQHASAKNGFTDTSSSTSGSNGSISTCTSYSKSASVTSSTVLPVCVQINNPPLSGPHKSDKNYVEALVGANHPTYFMKIFGITNEPVVARAVATLVSSTTTDYPCVVAVDQSTVHGIGGIKANGTPTVEAQGCGMYDNGAWTTDGSTVDVCAGYIGYNPNDGYTTNGSTSTSTTQPGCASPAPMAPYADPLSYLYQDTGYTPSTSPSTAFSVTNGQASPGIYNNIDISGGNVTLQPGLYVVNGNLTINGNANVTGNGVAFYITNGGAVTIDGTGNVQLSAPTTALSGSPAGSAGWPAGVLMYQDPTDTSTAKILGTSGSYFQGDLYFPDALVEFGGTDTTTGATFNQGASWTSIISSDVQFSGTATVYLNPAPSGSGGIKTIENALLVE